MRGIEIHILVDEMKKIVTVGSHGVTKVNDGYSITVMLGSNRTVIAKNIALGIGCHEGHSRSAGIFNIGIKPISGFTDTCRTDHHAVNVARIDETDRFLADGFTANDNTLLLWTFFLVGSPCARLVINLRIGFLDVLLGSPACRTVLSVSDGFILDPVKTVQIGSQGNENKKTAHDGGNGQQ